MKKDGIGEVIISPRYVKLNAPVVFLAGPIMGADDWQGKAIRYIKIMEPRLNIASPRRLLTAQDDFPEPIFQEQIHWEHHYIQLAVKNGVMLFWLAGESQHRCDRAYAQTTRFELGEAAATHLFSGSKVVVGVEDSFSGAKYIHKTLSKKYPNIPVRSNLEETCKLATRLAGI